MDSITMGGGVGLSARGLHCVATERTTLAMPEVGIGFIPDIGGTLLLGRAPDERGTRAALTAMRMSGADAVAIGLADHYVPSNQFADLRDVLLAADLTDAIAMILLKAAHEPPASAHAVARDLVTPCYLDDSMEAILAALDDCRIDAARETAATIRAQSPTSIKLTLRALRAARRLGVVESCLDQEYRIALRCERGHDFIERVRAAVVDKDRNPRRLPATLEAVDDASLDIYFASLGAAELGLTTTGL